jgi:SAM-dependent methyltransferase
MHSVLEHIPDINPTMKAIRKKLKKEGIFVFSVPNISSFEFFLYKLLRKPFAGFIYEHLYYFTPKSVSILLAKNGFKTLLMTSRHYATLKLPPRRPLIGWLTFPFKLLLEYTDLGGILRKGNIIYVYAEKNC